MFNPCFGGLVGQVTPPAGTSAPHHLFQSLFWWIGRSGPPNAPVHAADLAVSILVLVDWSVRSPRWEREGKRKRRFNPCFGGLVGQVSSPGPLVPRLLRFQSLFWWIGRSGSNPRSWRSRRYSFQSLFWWIGRSGSLPSSECSLIVSFQSLFWWIGRSGQQRAE